jgi:ParB-like chromosome segregation protein Spo0J
MADKIVMRPVEALIPYTRNARTHSDAQVAQIARSTREFGFTNPILVVAAQSDLGHRHRPALDRIGVGH